MDSNENIICPKCAKKLNFPIEWETIQADFQTYEQVWDYFQGYHSPPIVRVISVVSTVTVHKCKTCLHRFDFSQAYQHPEPNRRDFYNPSTAETQSFRLIKVRQHFFPAFQIGIWRNDEYVELKTGWKTTPDSMGLPEATGDDWYWVPGAVYPEVAVKELKHGNGPQGFTEVPRLQSEYDLTIAEADEEIRLDRNNANAFGVRADAYRMKWAFDLAIADATEAIRLDPKNGFAYGVRAECYRLKSNFDSAIADVTKALHRNHPNPAFLHRIRGASFHGKQQYDLAIQELTEAIQLDPHNGFAYAKRGYVFYFDKSDFAKALTDLTEAHRLDPYDIQVAKNLEAVKIRCGVVNPNDRYVAEATEAIRQDPKSARAYEKRADVYWQTGRIDDAIADASEAIRLDSTSAFAFELRACAYRSTNRTDLANADSKEAIRLYEPKEAWLNGRRTSVYKEAYEAIGDLPKARGEAGEAIKLEPNVAFSFVRRAYLWRAQNWLDEAITDATEAIRLEPHNELAFGLRADAYACKLEFDRAIADATEAIRLNKTYAYAYATRGCAFLRKGEFAEGTADLTQAKRLDRRYEWVDAHLMTELDRARRERLPMDKKEIIVCPKCTQKLNVPTDQGTLHVTCPRCKATWERLSATQVIITCPKCARSLSIPSGVGAIRASCPTCGEEWDWPTGTQSAHQQAPLHDNGMIRCRRCQHRIDAYHVSEQQIICTCPKCGTDCATDVALVLHNISHFPDKEQGDFDLPAELDQGLVTFVDDLKPSNFTVAGWLLFLPAYIATVCGFFFLCGLAMDLDGQRIGKITFIAISLVSYFLGLVLFLGGKWFFEKKLNIRVIKKLRGQKGQLDYGLAGSTSAEARQSNLQDMPTIQCEQCQHEIDLRTWTQNVCPKCGADCAHEIKEVFDGLVQNLGLADRSTVPRPMSIFYVSPDTFVGLILVLIPVALYLYFSR